MKKRKFLLKYHVKKFIRSIKYTYPIVFFLFSTFLFMIILVPNFSKYSPIIGNWDKVLVLKGTIRNDSVFKATTNIKVEIGGYCATADSDGKFSLKFLSKSLENVPVIITYGNKMIIKRINFTYRNNLFSAFELK